MSNNKNNNNNKKQNNRNKGSTKKKKNPRRRNNNKSLMKSVGYKSYEFGVNSIQMSRKDDLVHIRKQVESLPSIAPSTDYSVSVVSINPGQSTAHPWLYRQARMYDRYRYTYLEFAYIPSVNEVSPNGVGEICIGFDPDAADAVPSDMTQLKNMKPRSFGIPCRPLRVVVPQDYLRSLPWYYVRPGQLPGGTDIKTYDVGMLLVGTEGQANTTGVIGSLEVRYSIIFSSPTSINSSTQPPRNYNLASFTSTGQPYPSATPAPISFNTLTTNGTGITQVGTTGFKMPAGNWLVDMAVNLSNVGGISNYTLSPLLNGLATGLQSIWNPTGGTSLLNTAFNNVMALRTEEDDVLSFDFTNTTTGSNTNLVPQIVFTAL